VMIQGFTLGAKRIFAAHASHSSLRAKGNNDYLTLPKPEIIRDIGRQYMEAGGFIETNTCNSNYPSEDYGLGILSGSETRRVPAGARHVRFIFGRRPRLRAPVAGVLGPANAPLRSCRMSTIPLRISPSTSCANLQERHAWPHSRGSES